MKNTLPMPLSSTARAAQNGIKPRRDPMAMTAFGRTLRMNA
jgi:hypothetical protein